MSEETKTSVVTPVFIMNYPQLFKPKLNTLSKKMEYSVVAVFPVGTDLTKLKQAAHAAAVAKWGPEPAKWPKPNAGAKFNSPFRPHEDRMKTDEKTAAQTLPAPYEAGGFYMTLKNETVPGVVDEQAQKMLDAAQIYSGAKGIAIVNFHAYRHASGTVGVTAYLQAVQKVGDGVRIGGSTMNAEEAFKPIVTAAETGFTPAAGAAAIF